MTDIDELTDSDINTDHVDELLGPINSVRIGDILYLEMRRLRKVERRVLRLEMALRRAGIDVEMLDLPE